MCGLSFQILEGYGFLGSTDSLGEEVNSAFASVIGANTLKVVRGIVLTRAGLEDKARSSTVLPEIVKWLPPDLFRQCLAKVCRHFSEFDHRALSIV